jgi:hypothetical protein
MTTLVAGDDLARVQARAKVKAQALVAAPLPLHLVAGDLAVEPAQVMRARMLGMAQAIGALAASLGDLGTLAGECQVAIAASLERTLASGAADRARLTTLCNQAVGVEP